MFLVPQMRDMSFLVPKLEFTSFSPSHSRNVFIVPPAVKNCHKFSIQITKSQEGLKKVFCEFEGSKNINLIWRTKNNRPQI